MIDHVVVLFGFHHKPNPVRSIMTTQFLFRCRPHLYDQSHSCPIWFSSQSTPDLICHKSRVSFSMQIALVQSGTLLSCLVFLTNCTQSNSSSQFSFDFNIDQIYTINHVIVLFGFFHTSNSVRLVITTQFPFQCRLHLYNHSHRFPIWFSSQSVIRLITIQYRFWHKPHLYGRSW